MIEYKQHINLGGKMKDNPSKAILYAGLQMAIYLPVVVIISAVNPAFGWQALVMPMIGMVVASLLLWLPFVETIREKGYDFIREHFSFHLIMAPMMALLLMIARPEVNMAGLTAFLILTAYFFPIAGAMTFVAAYLAIRFPLKFK